MQSTQYNKPSTLRQAEYTMFGLHYKRYDELLKSADQLALMVRPPNILAYRIPDYHSILKQIYINYRPLLDSDARKKAETFFENIEKKLYKFSSDNVKKKQKTIKVDLDLIKDLETMHMRLLEIQQLIGLGINIKVTQKLKDTLKRVLLGET